MLTVNLSLRVLILALLKGLVAELGKMVLAFFTIIVLSIIAMGQSIPQLTKKPKMAVAV